MTRLIFAALLVATINLQWIDSSLIQATPPRASFIAACEAPQ